MSDVQARTTRPAASGLAASTRAGNLASMTLGTVYKRSSDGERDILEEIDTTGLGATNPGSSLTGVLDG